MFLLHTHRCICTRTWAHNFQTFSVVFSVWNKLHRLTHILMFSSNCCFYPAVMALLWFLLFMNLLFPFTMMNGNFSNVAFLGLLIGGCKLLQSFFDTCLSFFFFSFFLCFFFPVLPSVLNFVVKDEVFDFTIFVEVFAVLFVCWDVHVISPLKWLILCL